MSGPYSGRAPAGEEPRGEASLVPLGEPSRRPPVFFRSPPAGGGWARGVAVVPPRPDAAGRAGLAPRPPGGAGGGGVEEPAPPPVGEVVRRVEPAAAIGLGRPCLYAVCAPNPAEVVVERAVLH